MRSRTSVRCPGSGLTAVLERADALRRQSRLRFRRGRTRLPRHAVRAAKRWRRTGKTPLLFSENGRLLGVIAVADVIKPDSPQAVRELRNMGIERRHAHGRQRAHGAAPSAPPAGVDRVIAGVLPDGKEAEIRRLQRARQGRYGRRRHQRRSCAHPRGRGHRHRRGRGRRASTRRTWC